MPIAKVHPELIGKVVCYDCFASLERQIPKCPHCGRIWENGVCMRCQGVIVNNKCTNCGSLIGATRCSGCSKWVVWQPIDWALIPKPIPAIWEAILFDKEEDYLALWSGDRETVKRASGNFGTTNIGVAKESGALILSNQRLIWVGSYNEGFKVSCTVPLEDITGISGTGSSIPVIVVSTQFEDYLFHLTSWLVGYKTLIDHTLFSPFVQEAVVKRRAQLKVEESTNKNVQIVLDFSALKDVMSKGGLVLSTYKCPNCNGMVKLPEEGKVLVCEYCGTPIKPVDIFEKIKTLIT